VLLAAALALTAAPARASGAPDPSKALARQALAANPGLKSVEEQVAALGRRVDAASVWKDPVLALEYSNVPWDGWSLGDSPMSGVQLRVQQTIPFPGKDERARAVAEQHAETRRWELRERRLRLAGEVRRGFWKLALVRQLEELTREHVGLVEQLIAVVRARYEVGRGAQHELLRLELFRDKLRDDLGDFERDARHLTAAVNAAAGREAGAAVDTPDVIPAPPVGRELAALLEQAGEERPLLQQWSSRARAHRKAAERVHHDRWPDVTVWAGWRFRREAGMDPGTDFVSLGVSVPLPLDLPERREASRAAYLAEARAAERGRDAATYELRAGVERALATSARALSMAAAYEESLIKQARATLDAATAAYQSGRADFASLFQAEVQLLQLERALRRARFTAMSASIEVETLVGAAVHKEDER